MAERYVSERLLNELPKSLINFIWYLWEAYFDPAAEGCLFLLQSGGSGQRVVIPQLNKTFEQDFGTAVDVTILIKKDGAKYYMSQK